MKKNLSVIFSMLLVLILALAGCSGNSEESNTNADENSKTSSLLDTVIKRGTLKAGVNDALPGFGYIDSDGKNTGFDVDFARAIAAGVLGDASKIEFRPLSATDRFTALQSKEVDVLIRNSTWTTNRDAEVGLSFAPVTFYDGQGIMVPKDSGWTSLEDLEGKTIGVETGTTTELNLADQMKAAGVSYTPQTFDNADAVIAAYESGSIDAWTTDKSGLVSRQSMLQDPDAHIILDATLSKEPLAPAVLDNDEKWKDAVSWIVYATIQAEEFGITSENVDEFLESENPEIQRLLGVGGNNLGEQLGLSNDFAYQVIKQVGNYGEIYNRNLGPDTVFKLERGQNALYSDGGLLYSIPFR
ncbi:MULTISPECIES: amino acid ABC transporter substrate-binding protein [Bacillaceae]|uniref:amino acid ABC transporter substrate-binding protein n=1 Tax=Bacillaceae TaxID=186817 RepID=UPI001E3F9D9A|nr:MULTISPECIES: amino acid ABC transporter substrate-binding protein [Bacillaceae]MCE4048510.1 transporter substrate-binding domain-containing protein [Bacillus sp. Au-Bac7]MCM3029183.1 transporter substrate-binding domain-containing protein [Niallia sp. MER 6]MDL0434930.1 transporter substrate-binding domain-containing protein [Niallia sp. SS-2023]UPO88741.1 transporter substrate-binding domain-containing protein [Niallia sp. Man26]